MFYSEGVLRTSSPGDSISSNSERTAPRRCGRSQVIPKGVKEQVVWTTKDYCSLRKTRHLKLRKLVIVYVWEEARVWTHWNHSSCASQLSGVSLLHNRREWLQPDPSIVFLPGCPGELESPMTVASLFIDMARNTPFLTPDPQKELFSLTFYGRYNWTQEGEKVQQTSLPRFPAIYYSTE